MININKKEIYQKTLGKFGEKNRIIKTIEELAELIKELTHFLISDPKFNPHNLISKIVDSEIMIEQLKNIFSIEEELLKTIKEIKLNKLIELIYLKNND